eukprot:2776322-Rhodomonas_salina.1
MRLTSEVHRDCDLLRSHRNLEAPTPWSSIPALSVDRRRCRGAYARHRTTVPGYPVSQAVGPLHGRLPRSDLRIVLLDPFCSPGRLTPSRRQDEAAILSAGPLTSFCPVSPTPSP